MKRLILGLAVAGVALIGFSGRLLAGGLREEPEREFRGVWMPTVVDPRFCASQASQTIAEIKARYRTTLDAARRVRANVVFFQVRPCADAFYRGALEPWSIYLRGSQTKEPEEGFDPLRFMIDEAHARGLQLHAWFNPFRVTYRPEEVSMLAPDHLYRREPERFVTYGKSVYFDPGLPENRDWTARVIADCVSRYDVDGVHLDDYFYPYAVRNDDGTVRPFPDERSYAKYGAGKPLADWRRANAEVTIAAIRKRINDVKPGLVFGISPNSNYRKCYDTLHADVVGWIKRGYIDYTIPQLYHLAEGNRPGDDPATLTWWSDNASARRLFAGLNLNTLMNTVTNGPYKGLRQIDAKMVTLKAARNYTGICLWPAVRLTENRNGVADAVADYCREIALVPQFEGRDTTPPASVTDTRVVRDGLRVALTWRHPPADGTHKAVFTAVYRGDARHPVAVVHGTSFDLGPAPEGVWRLVALDRLQNAAEPVVVEVK